MPGPVHLLPPVKVSRHLFSLVPVAILRVPCLTNKHRRHARPTPFLVNTLCVGKLLAVGGQAGRQHACAQPTEGNPSSSAHREVGSACVPDPSKRRTYRRQSRCLTIPVEAFCAHFFWRYEGLFGRTIPRPNYEPAKHAPPSVPPSLPEESENRKNEPLPQESDYIPNPC